MDTTKKPLKSKRNLTRFTYETAAFEGWRLCLSRAGSTFTKYFPDKKFGDGKKSLAAAEKALTDLKSVIDGSKRVEGKLSPQTMKKASKLLAANIIIVLLSMPAVALALPPGTNPSGTAPSSTYTTSKFGNGTITRGNAGNTYTTGPFGSGSITRDNKGSTYTTSKFGTGTITRGPDGTYTTSPFGNGTITRGPSGTYTTTPFGNGTITRGPSGTYTTSPFGNGTITRGK